MFVTIYWIDTSASGRLGIMARPRGDDWLEDEICFLESSGVNLLVSLLTDAEQLELGLLDEGMYCAQHQMSYITFPIQDRQTPPLTHTTGMILQQLAHALNDGKTIVIHCRMGIGRAAVIAASILAVNGLSVDAAFTAITIARGCPVPDTPEQRTWVEQFRQWYHNKRGIMHHD
jgi:protein-tyrosine phosphatase